MLILFGIFSFFYCDKLFWFIVFILTDQIWQEVNTGRPKRNGAVCRRTAYKAICATSNVN